MCKTNLLISFTVSGPDYKPWKVPFHHPLVWFFKCSKIHQNIQKIYSSIQISSKSSENQFPFQNLQPRPVVFSHIFPATAPFALELPQVSHNPSVERPPETRGFLTGRIPPSMNPPVYGRVILWRLSKSMNLFKIHKKPIDSIQQIHWVNPSFLCWNLWGLIYRWMINRSPDPCGSWPATPSVLTGIGAAKKGFQGSVQQIFNKNCSTSVTHHLHVAIN